MRVKIKAKIQNMSQKAILDMIKYSKLQEIKQIDDKPEFRVYAVGHEGDAEANLVGFGQKVFHYVKEAIKKIGNKIKVGTPFFEGHTVESNDINSRVKIGEVVGKALKSINDKLHAITVAYIYPEFRNKKLDIASIEADVEYSNIDDKYAQVENVNDITGIALGSSEVDKPGFPGATLLGVMHALRINHSKNEGNNMTIEEIVKVIKDNKHKPQDVFDFSEIKPSEIYDHESLVQDPIIVDHVKKEKQTEYEHAKRIEKKLGQERDDWTKKEKDFSDRIASLTKENLNSKVKTAFKEIADSRKLDEKQVKFIENNISRFKSETDDEKVFKIDLDKFVDGQLEDYTNTAKLFGIDLDKDKKNGIDKGSPPGDELIDDVDYEKPENNPLMP